MDYESLSAAQRRTYQAAVSQTHHRRVEMTVVRQDGKYAKTFANAFLGGQVDTDEDSTPAQTLSSVEVYDPERRLDWENGAHRRYNAIVTDSRFIPALNDWVDCTVFTGPIWDFSRKGPVASLTGQGSERLAMGSVRSAYTRPRKTKATTVIRDLLVKAGVPPRLRRVPSMKAVLPESVTVRIKVKVKGKGDKKAKVKLSHKRRIELDREDTYFEKAAEVAASINRVLVTDGKGRFIVRRHPTKVALTIDDSHLVEPPETSRVADADLRNVFVVIGANPKGPKGRIRHEARFPKSHVLSAESLAPWGGGFPYELIDVYQNDKIATKARAREIATRRRDRAMREVVEYSVAMLPVAPWLQQGQILRVQGRDTIPTVRARRISLPLGTGADPQTVGSLRRTSAPQRRLSAQTGFRGLKKGRG